MLDCSDRATTMTIDRKALGREGKRAARVRTATAVTMVARTVLCALAVLSVCAPGAAKPTADFARLKVGQIAYLSAQLESDDEPHTRPVCRTYEQQIAFWRMQLDNCPHRKWGTVVFVTAIRPGISDDRTIALDKSIPFVQIRSQDGRWTGWVQSISLEPIIPAGTRLQMKTVGNAVPSVYRHKSDPIGKDVSLGSPVTVEVLRHEPPSGDCTLLVRALNGAKKGLTGWTCDNGTIEGTNLSSTYLNP